MSNLTPAHLEEIEQRSRERTIGEMSTIRDMKGTTPETRHLLNLTIYATRHRRFPPAEAFRDPAFKP